ncbi:MAG TPA: glutamate formimidoyltransferase [Saprospiraceae bacterium]|nr:glutamate formimidoyltransferase [Saprospiraceae bacterium]HNT19632.1 glutamate formimidoyltransferase [Saprospiraceae bacterium]
MLECVPNFSEGRDKQIIARIRQGIESVAGVKVLHTDMGFDAHRTVITFAGKPEACLEAAWQSVRIATGLIDMRHQKGAHPRLGAVDVFPFVPLQGSEMTEAIDCARILAERVGRELRIPVYLYGEAALRANRKNLAEVRKGEYEGLNEKLKLEEWKPDFGPTVFNEKSGALITGARKVLVAYNINLAGGDAALAQKIARQLREKNGGLKAVRAIGWWMPAFNCPQVSCNLVDLDLTPLHLVFDTCCRLAEEMGTRVTGSELVGLVPVKVLTDAADFYNQGKTMTEKEKLEFVKTKFGLSSVKPFDPSKQIIEKALGGWQPG